MNSLQSHAINFQAKGRSSGKNLFPSSENLIQNEDEAELAIHMQKEDREIWVN